MGANEQEIRRFITETFLFGDDRPLASDESFSQKGTIDSTGMHELLNFIEERFRIEVRPEDLVPANLDSIDRLLAFIARKQSAGQGK